MRKRNLIKKQLLTFLLAASLTVGNAPVLAADFSSTEEQQETQESTAQEEAAQNGQSDVQLELGLSGNVPSDDANIEQGVISGGEEEVLTNGLGDGGEENFTSSENPDTFDDGTSNSSEEGIQYIKGRPLTEEERQEQLAPFEELAPLESVPEIGSDLGTIPYGMASSFPAQYDSRNAGLITSVKNQEPYGMCWSFAMASVLETSLLKSGFGTYDLSEEHLAYFLANRQNDPLGNTAGDTNYHPADFHQGGNDYIASLFLSTWSGMTTEADVPLATDATHTVKYSTVPSLSKAYNTVAYLENAAFSDYSVERMKTLLMTYDSVSIMYNAQSSYLNADTAAYSYPYGGSVNHVVTVVGWDDNYAKENFKAASNVKNDGAWIVKNSWDADWGDEGYFYLSYEDATISALTSAQATATPAYRNNYFYDGTSGLEVVYFDPGESLATVFTAKAGGSNAEALGEVVTACQSDSGSYTIQVYTNLTDPSNPTSGSPAYAQPIEVYQALAGVQTNTIPEVTILPGTKYSIVITNAGSKTLNYYCEATANYTWISFKPSISINQGLWNSGTSWIDMGEGNMTPRIKAHTRTLGSAITPTLTLGNKSLNLGIGETGTLNATVNPSNIQLGYTSSDKNVATVSASGKVTAVGPGTATITCKSQDSTALSAACKVSVTMPTPTNLKAEVKAYNTVALTWDGAAGINYVVRRQAVGESAQGIAIISSGVSNYTDQTAQPGIKYTYTVRPYVTVSGNNLYGTSSSGVTVTTALDKPVFATKASGSVYNLVSWTKVSGAQGYRIYRKTPSGSWKTLATVERTVVQYKDKTAAALASYQYTVRAYRVVNGKKTFGPYTTGEVIQTAPATQKISSVKAESTGIRVRWTAQSACDGYRIYRKEKNGSWTSIKVITKGSTASYLDKTAKKGTTYYYAVRAYVTESYGRVYSKYTASSAVKR